MHRIAELNSADPGECARSAEHRELRRLQIGDTADFKSALPARRRTRRESLHGLKTFVRIPHASYRRIEFCGPWGMREECGTSRALPIANRRYSRFQICATGASADASGKLARPENICPHTPSIGAFPDFKVANIGTSRQNWAKL